MADTTAPRNRLPTLFEVLEERTFPPVDVESFRRYLRTENSEEYFEFW